MWPSSFLTSHHTDLPFLLHIPSSKLWQRPKGQMTTGPGFSTATSDAFAPHAPRCCFELRLRRQCL